MHGIHFAVTASLCTHVHSLLEQFAAHWLDSPANHRALQLLIMSHYTNIMRRGSNRCTAFRPTPTHKPLIAEPFIMSQQQNTTGHVTHACTASNPRTLLLAAGLVLMQLSIAKLRLGNGLKAFNTALKASGFDLMCWRRKANLPARNTAILDADDGSGWELAEALLRPREIEVDEESGSVKFVNSNHEAIRLGVGLALTHKFMKQVWRCHLACCW